MTEIVDTQQPIDLNERIDNQPDTLFTFFNRVGTWAGIGGFFGGAAVTLASQSHKASEIAEKILSPDVMSKGPEIMVGSVVLAFATVGVAVFNGRTREMSESSVVSQPCIEDNPLL